ncbi:MAG: hypothetical protein K2N05_07850 [Muribaculaceae bacterium]|nr:hypothetical protein [Muribaculaceae bacterium]
MNKKYSKYIGLFLWILAFLLPIGYIFLDAMTQIGYLSVDLPVGKISLGVVFALSIVLTIIARKVYKNWP